MSRRPSEAPPRAEAPTSAESAPNPARGRWLAALGVAAAMVVTLCFNILAARHYRRWDATSAGLYTLSRVTEETLKGMRDPVEVYVLLPETDPLTLTLRHLLEAYRSLAPRLESRFVDPDRDPAAFLAVQQKYGVSAAKSEEGRIVTDANIIVVRGDRRHFITSDELFEVESGEEMRARSRAEQVLTAALRQVTAGVPPQICFTTGHGEPDLGQGGVEGLMALQGRLVKTNYQVKPLEPLRELEGKDDIDRCNLVVVAGPSLPLGDGEVARLQRYFGQGGNLLVFIGPELDDSGSGYVDVGLAPLLAAAGIRKRDDIVFELDSGRRWPIGQGEAFIAQPSAHPITEGFVELGGAISIVLTIANSLEVRQDAVAKPTALLRTSEAAFGMRDFLSWAKSRPEPTPSSDDARGPLVVAYAVELPKRKAAESHGARMVVVGTKSAVVGANWVNERLQGTALFVESAISWLASEPIVLDIPAKPAKSLATHITEDTLAAVALKVVFFIPLSMVLLGTAIWLRRRAREGRQPVRQAPPDDEHDDDGEHDDSEHDDDGEHDDSEHDDSEHDDEEESRP